MAADDVLLGLLRRFVNPALSDPIDFRRQSGAPSQFIQSNPWRPSALPGAGAATARRLAQLRSV